VPALAASALVTIGVLTFRSSRENTQPVAAAVQPRMVATGVGVRDSVTLPDGSRVILGPMSSIRISGSYEKGVREVEVAGDAWFDVAKREGVGQFTVRAGSATIVDIGTRFAVQSDAADGVSVTVTEGKVSVAAANQPAAKTVLLEAGDNALLGKDGTIRTRRGTVTEDDLAWMSGRLVFRETPMSEVASAIHRWYGIELRMEDPSFQSRRITATFTGETPDAMLDVLRLVLGATIVKRGDTAVVTSGGRSLR
jgi:transmembrane sensor